MKSTTISAALVMVIFFACTGATADELWRHVTSLAKSDCSILAYAPNGTVYAAYNTPATTGGKVYRSTDDGRTWSLVNGTDWNRITLITTTASNTVFVGTYGTGLYRSTDNGVTWTNVVVHQDYTDIQAAAAGADGNLYVACGSLGGQWMGLFRSGDNGATWSAISQTASYNYCWGICASSKGTVVASLMNSGIVRSANQGARWDTVRAVPAGMLVPGANDEMIGLEIDWGAGVGISHSTDDGQTWQEINAGLPGTQMASIAADAQGELFASHETGIYHYSRQAQAWSKVSTGVDSAQPVAVMALAPAQTMLAASRYGGVQRSSDRGIHWEQTQYPSDNTIEVRSVLIDNNATLFAGTGNADALYCSKDSGASWHPSTAGITASGIGTLARNRTNGHLYAGSNRYGFFRSVDGGLSWTKKSPGTASTQVQALAVNAQGDVFAGTYFHGIYRSSNEGDEWTEVNDGITYTNIASLLVLSNGDLLAGSGAVPLGGNAVFRSSDNGAHWHKVIDRACVSFVQARSGKVLALIPDTYGDKVLISEDNGETWGDPRTAGSGSIYGGVCMAANSKDELFVGSENLGVYTSRDGASSWKQMSFATPVLSSAGIACIAFDSRDIMYLGTPGQGLFKSVQPIVTAAEDHIDAMLPLAARLYQNFPNPFNPSTSVRFDIPKACVASLKVYDALGRERAVIFSGWAEAGAHRLGWNASALPGGMYFYRLRAGAYEETKRMALVK